MQERFPTLRRGGTLLALLGSLVLAACSGIDRRPPPCPSVSGVADARYLIRFGPGGLDLTDVLFEAEIKSAALVCEYDDNVVEADMRLSIEAVRGPADIGRLARFSYFVAIATRDRKILARKEFSLEIPFPGNRTRVALVEELSQSIPLKPGQNGADYIIYVGLAMTAKELQYNLDNR